jgi:hypothetical protein
VKGKQKKKKCKKQQIKNRCKILTITV